ncbi:MAG TPA: hypothetical protein VIN03_16700 [Roseateles sp.]
MATDPTTKNALDLITGALRKTGEYAAGEPISNEDANAALDSLNGLLDVLSNEHLAVYNNNENIISLTPGKSTYTVGVGGEVNIQRPLRITQAYSRLTTSGSPVDFPCDLVDTDGYTSIGLKQQPGPWPKRAYYNASFPLAQLYLWPVPTQAAEFHFWTDMLFQPESLTSTVSLPQGYYLFLQYALAEVLCADYGIPVPPDTRRLAEKYKKILKGNNSTPDRIAAMDGAILPRGANDAGFILTGGF